MSLSSEQQAKVARVLSALNGGDVRALQDLTLPELAELRAGSPALARALDSEQALALLCQLADDRMEAELGLSALDRHAQNDVQDILLSRIKEPLPAGVTALDIYEALRALDTTFLDLAPARGNALVWKGRSLVSLRLTHVKSFGPPAEPTIVSQSVLDEELAEALELWAPDGKPAPRVQAVCEWLRSALSQVPELLWNFTSAPVEDSLLITRQDATTLSDGQRWLRKPATFGPLQSQAFNRTWVWHSESAAWLVGAGGHAGRPQEVPEEARCAIVERADLNFVLASFLAQPQQTPGGVSGMAVPIEQCVQDEHAIVLERRGVRIELQTF